MRLRLFATYESYQHGGLLQCSQGKKIVFRILGFTLSTLGSVPSNVFKVPKTTVNTFDGTDPKVNRIKPKVRNAIFFPVVVCMVLTYSRLRNGDI